ncbi:hypothetical protein LTS08_001957 [Lithohypha guttulata]|nr:hypothetical protein LTS08_001957 [Lithohypha guttulata]
MKTSTFITASLMLAATSAIPAVADANSVSIVQKIAPKSNACAGGEFPDECATSDQATSALIQSFIEYNIVTPGEQSALISLMAFETGDFKYVRNHYPAPGRPGQGCRNMMMPEFVAEYAKAKYPSITTTDPGALLNEVIKQGGEWGAASWFYTTKCSDAVKQGLKSGSKAGFSAFITECVGTTATDERLNNWSVAAKAVGLAGV